ncbi:MAG: DUF6009 family protein [Methanoregula sp.]|jgi:hypothetical protein|uniref:DUF6009 family protein n=1 Tax=Methanoregula sp. TaxID=2052170 RepID=UPI003D0FD58E
MPEIVWLEDPLEFTYLRETYYCTCSPVQIRLKTPIWREQAKIVGYETIPVKERKACGGMRAYTRRVWWLKKYDRDIDPSGVYATHWPCEAVLPSSIGLGKESVRYASYLLEESKKVPWGCYSDHITGLSESDLLAHIRSQP